MLVLEEVLDVFVANHSLVEDVGAGLGALDHLDYLGVVANAAFKVLTTDFGWLYLISMIIFFGFIVYFAFGKYGKIRLGSDDSRPEYSNMTW